MNLYSSIWINYFSGTGNALTASRWIAENASKLGMDAYIRAIDRFDPHAIDKAADAKYCPVEAIRIVDDRPYWTYHCESCMRCMNICPPQAIETSHSIAALMIALTTSLPVTYWLTVLAKNNRLALSDTVFSAADYILTWLLSLAIFYIVYILIFALIRNPVINRFFVYTSLTYYWTRYKMPGIDLKDFQRTKQD